MHVPSRCKLLVAVAILVVGGLSASEALLAAKAPAIPKFQLQYWDIPNRVGSPLFGRMNNVGQIVGYYYRDSSSDRHPYFYDPKVNLTTAVDLDAAVAGAGVPEGWRIATARGINDQGVIVGDLTGPDPVTGVAIDWGYVLDTKAALPQVVPLANVDGWHQSRAAQINEIGDIVGKYEVDGVWGWFFFNPADHLQPYYPSGDVKSAHLNNPVGTRPAQVALGMLDNSIFRWTPEWNSLENLGNLGMVVADMNDAGTMCGQVSPGYPVRLITPPPRTFDRGNLAWGVNASNDIIIDTGFLYRDDVGYVWLPAYLSGSAADLSKFSSSAYRFYFCLSNRGATSNYGQVAGSLTFHAADGSSTYQPFLLTPIVKGR